MNNSLATDKQVAYLSQLVSARIGRALTEEELDRARNLSRPAASRLIGIEMDRRALRRDTPYEAPKAPTVPSGYYAVEIDGELGFYKVETPEEGKWAGVTFVKRQSGDNLERLPYLERAEVVELISNDPRAALIRYGTEIGRCGVCNRTLTDEASREAGIGPVCAKKAGF